MPKAAPLEEKHWRLYTVGEIEFTKIIQPVTKQIKRQTTTIKALEEGGESLSRVATINYLKCPVSNKKL